MKTAVTGDAEPRPFFSYFNLGQNEPAPVDPADVPMESWAQFRTEAGINDSGEFLGIGTWRRPQHVIHHEPTAMEKWAEERKAAGIHDAPQASASDQLVKLGPLPGQIWRQQNARY